MAMPSEIGHAIRSARHDEYSVPQMNDRAPNCPATGSQTSVVQNRSPNFEIDSRDSRTSSTPMPATITSTSSANAPVISRNPRSLVARVFLMCLLEFDLVQLIEFRLHRRLR